MLYMVEVHHIGSDLAKMMAEMRTWLDHCQIQTIYFQHLSCHQSIVIGFRVASDAVAFAESFQGRFLEATNSSSVKATPAESGGGAARRTDIAS
jgi:hypothetical protein